MPRVRTKSLSSLLDASDDAPENMANNSAMTHSLYFHPAGRTGDVLILFYLLTALFVVGTALGFLIPPPDDLHGPYRRVSAVLGWIYFCSWSISFYPQAFLNFRRKTTVGLSFDYLVYNVLAFMCYCVYNCFFYWSEGTQRAYERRHAGNENKVQFNDVMFAIHAVLLSALTLSQALYYDWREGRQRPSRTCVIAVSSTVLWALVYGCAVLISTSKSNGVDDAGYGIFRWLDYLYFLSYVKLVVTFVKYCPQVWLNARRQSTKGWTIWNVILDLTGGVLSTLQLVLDCWNTNDWSGISGNLVKFGIGFVGVFFDLVFLFQHYVLYASRSSGKDELYSATDPSDPLLTDRMVSVGPGEGR